MCGAVCSEKIGLVMADVLIDLSGASLCNLNNAIACSNFSFFFFFVFCLTQEHRIDLFQFSVHKSLIHLLRHTEVIIFFFLNYKSGFCNSVLKKKSQWKRRNEKHQITINGHSNTWITSVLFVYFYFRLTVLI